jgi:hypothetical protein
MLLIHASKQAIVIKYELYSLMTNIKTVQSTFVVY